MNTRMISWQDPAEPNRLDAATVQLGADALDAVGTSRTAEYAASWRLESGADWVTRTLHVSVQGFGWSRELTLSRSEDGTWQSKARSTGKVRLPAPGLAQPDTLLDAVDCDLELSPLTPSLPAKRLGLADRDRAEVDLVVAHVEMPSLRVIRRDLGFASERAADGGQLLTIRDLEGVTPERRVSLDADGLVADGASA